MNVTRDPDAILAAWLEEGPTALPEPTRRAIAVVHPNHPIDAASDVVAVEDSDHDGMSRFALAAVAVVAVVVVGDSSSLRPGADQPGGVGGPGSPVPSASTAPSPSAPPSASAPPSTPPSLEPSVGALTHGIHLAHVPAIRSASPAGVDRGTSDDWGRTAPADADDSGSAAGRRYLARPVPARPGRRRGR